MSNLLELCMDLISRPSITPDDQGCQNVISTFLKKLGFSIIELNFNNVKNLWAIYGNEAPVFVFAGHTDVVPAGNKKDWSFEPFEPTIDDNKLYGRGTADMKGAIAAMLVATQNFLLSHPKPKGSLAFLITSDEEGQAQDGTVKVVEWLKNKNIMVDYCLVGEATCEKVFGDTIKVGRRGSLNGSLTIFGKQGHIAYPSKAKNPIHLSFNALNEIASYPWDSGNIHFDPTSLQFSNINSGLGVSNVIPPDLTAQFNLRYSPELNSEDIQKIIASILEKNHLHYDINYHHSGKPYYSKPERLASSLQKLIQQKLRVDTVFSTSGGTSDGRFLIDICREIVEFGVVNESIHKVNEYVKIDDLTNLAKIYEYLLETLL